MINNKRKLNIKQTRTCHRRGFYSLASLLFTSAMFLNDYKAKAAPLADPQVALQFDFGIRECTLGDDSSLQCVENILIGENLDIALPVNGGLCLSFGSNSDSTPNHEQAELAQNMIDETRSAFHAPASIQEQNRLGCAYSWVRSYDETFLPLVLIETSSQRAKMLLSLARSSSAGTQIESVEMNFQTLEALKAQTSVFLRAREVSRKESALIFPFFRVTPNAQIEVRDNF